MSGPAAGQDKGTVSPYRPMAWAQFTLGPPMGLLSGE